MVDTQKIMRKESKQNIIESHQSPGKKGAGEKWNRGKLQNSQKTINKMALVSPYILIITININDIISPI